MASSTPEERWAKWSAYFDDVEREMITLFHTRWMWRTIIELLRSSEVKQYTVVQNYFVRTYVATVCTAIRREADRDSRTTSLARCLQLLIDSPQTITRTRFTALVKETADVEDADGLANDGFNKFAPSGGEFVERTGLEESLARLDLAAAPVRRYTNQVLAHRQRTGGNIEEVQVTFDDINHALDELGEITKQYYQLRHPAVMLGMLTPAADLTFLNMFRRPWWSEGFVPPNEMDLG